MVSIGSGQKRQPKVVKRGQVIPQTAIEEFKIQQNRDKQSWRRVEKAKQEAAVAHLQSEGSTLEVHSFARTGLLLLRWWFYQATCSTALCPALVISPLLSTVVAQAELLAFRGGTSVDALSNADEELDIEDLLVRFDSLSCNLRQPLPFPLAFCPVERQHRKTSLFNVVNIIMYCVGALCSGWGPWKSAAQATRRVCPE